MLHVIFQLILIICGGFMQVMNFVLLLKHLPENILLLVRLQSFILANKLQQYNWLGYDLLYKKNS